MQLAVLRVSSHCAVLCCAVLLVQHLPHALLFLRLALARRMQAAVVREKIGRGKCIPLLFWLLCPGHEKMTRMDHLGPENLGA